MVSAQIIRESVEQFSSFLQIGSERAVNGMNQKTDESRGDWFYHARLQADTPLPLTRHRRTPLTET